MYPKGPLRGERGEGRGKGRESGSERKQRGGERSEERRERRILISPPRRGLLKQTAPHTPLHSLLATPNELSPVEREKGEERRKSRELERERGQRERREGKGKRIAEEREI